MEIRAIELENRRDWTFIIQNEEDTEKAACLIAPLLRSGELITLSGELGAGKTTFARCLIRTLMHQPDLDVTSPTFLIMQPYEGMEFKILHADLYRLSDPSELAELGFEELAESSITLVEWPERVPLLFENADLNISIVINNTQQSMYREISISAKGLLSSRIDRTLYVEQFLQNNGWENSSRAMIAGDASGRKYERLIKNGLSSILMTAPTPLHGPVIKNNKTYRMIAKLSDSVETFVAVSAGLREAGFSAPDIYAYDSQTKQILAEDFGVNTIFDSDGPITDRYREAVRLLSSLHNLNLSQEISARGNIRYKLPAYDMEALLIELELFIDWYLPKFSLQEISLSARHQFLDIWTRMLKPLQSEQHSWTLRDFHSPNLFWLENRTGFQRIGLIDIQDAVWGHPAYDLGSLLQDARIPISDSFEIEMFEEYVQLRLESDPTFNEPSFSKAYATYSMQRVTKILGIFVRLQERDNKPEYIRHLPHMLAYLHRNLNYPEMANYRDWLAKNCPSIFEIASE